VRQEQETPSPTAEEYARRLHTRSQAAERWQSLDKRLSNVRLGVFLLGIVQAFLTFGTRDLAGIWLLPTVGTFVALLIFHDRVIQRRRRSERSVAFYDRGIARLEDRWAGTGNQRRPNDSLEHAFAEDLDLFGEGSLFELLCTARTAAGQDKLATWLLHPARDGAAAANEIRARQVAVGDLRERLDLREDLCLLGEDVRSQLDPAALIRWGAGAGPAVSSVPRIAALTATGLSLGALAAALFSDAGAIPLLFALFFQSVIGLAVRQRVQEGIRSASDATRDLSLLSGLLARLEIEPAASPRLCQLQEALGSQGMSPSRCIAQLQRLADQLDARRNQFFAPIGFFLMWGTQFALAVENWRAHHGTALERWVDAAAEYEALCSLASYAYEHPEDPFPEIVESEALFEGEELGHPLLPAERCVRNSVRLSGTRQAYMVSGSNMSGKSTLLRTVGVAAVMALAGAPVRARSLRLSPLALGASIRVTDSLRDGTSHFYAEIKRLRQVMSLTEDRTAVLFLLDEVLHGTNSHDRRIGAEAVVRGLLTRGAVGLITTHDLALAQVADELAPAIENVHFQDQLDEGKMRFDYRLWPGVVTRSNALELMRAVGLEV
jgi:hypothetical protein